ncbi:MAG: hypothetical protein KZQ81_12105 [Candidatus Thiodiazotropha sp. (ex Rostrolucina anterorostrata)]|nr:hypothetical protein [Candidatus Thiodiazotropha sp. (ex Rostrolucina anterorostrata)]
MLLSLTLLLIGALISGFAIRQLIFKRKVLVASLNGLLGLALLLAASFVSMLLFNIQSYVQLTKEQVLAEIEVGIADSERTPLTLTIAGREKVYPISANEWRIDARFIKWKPWMALLGKDPVVRLESLSGRGALWIDRGSHSFDLHADFEIVDKIISNLTDRFGMVDSMYGSSVYMPIAAGARYQISATHSGLIARPINDLGKQAVMVWGRQ